MGRDLNHRMGDLHEAWFARLFSGVRSPGSGNQLINQGDGRRSTHRFGLGWVWDCKSTLHRSLSVSLDMWDKLTEQAGTDHPLLPIRFYLNNRLTECVDLVVMAPDDLIETLELLEEAERRLDKIRDGLTHCLPRYQNHPMVVKVLEWADGE
jgi:hypothetical protein